LEKLRVQLGTATAQVERYRSLSEQSMVSKGAVPGDFRQRASAPRQISSSEAAASNAELQLELLLHSGAALRPHGQRRRPRSDLVRASDANISLSRFTSLNPIYVTFGVPQQNLALLGRYRGEGAVGVAAAPAGSEEATEKGEADFPRQRRRDHDRHDQVEGNFPQRRLIVSGPGSMLRCAITLASPKFSPCHTGRAKRPEGAARFRGGPRTKPRNFAMLSSSVSFDR